MQPARVKIPPLISLAVPLLQLITPLIEEIEAQRLPAEELAQQQQWVAGFLLSLLGSPILTLDERAPIAGTTAGAFAHMLVGLLWKCRITPQQILEYVAATPKAAPAEDAPMTDATNAAAADEDDDEDDESEEEEQDMIVPWPVDGIAAVQFYLTVVEPVAGVQSRAPVQQLVLSMPFASALLKITNQEAVVRGQLFAAALLKDVPENSLDVPALSDDVIAFAESLVNFIAACSEPMLRRQTFDMLSKLLGVVTEPVRFALLHHLLERCPFASVTALMVTRVKTELIKHWTVDGSVFASPRVLDLLKCAMHVSRELQPNIDVFMSALNLFRFLWMRDMDDSVTGVRSDVGLQVLLRSVAARSREVAQVLEEQLAKCKLPEANATEQRVVMLEKQQNIVQLLLDSVSGVVQMCQSSDLGARGS
eukprot:TRINITY_DN2491_c0_g3_i1.p1 TRINITY_DN2491_c0_g3~~TRINITY_DN2491_c0_g3_i1.p1  ORF type:complete len:422 (-),score=139.21 TRINITY_DN2491_c0_g3_i1:176-1441(-)